MSYRVCCFLCLAFRLAGESYKWATYIYDVLVCCFPRGQIEHYPKLHIYARNNNLRQHTSTLDEFYRTTITWYRSSTCCLEHPFYRRHHHHHRIRLSSNSTDAIYCGLVVDLLYNKLYNKSTTNRISGSSLRLSINEQRNKALNLRTVV